MGGRAYKVLPQRAALSERARQQILIYDWRQESKYVFGALHDGSSGRNGEHILFSGLFEKFIVLSDRP